MSNAEKIADKVGKKFGYSVVPEGYADSGQRRYGCSDDELIECVVNQTLQELKEKVEKMYNLADERYGNETLDEKRIEYSTLIDCYKTVFQLINDHS